MNAKTILAAVDFSDVTPLVVEAARSMAAAFGGRIILLHVEEPEPDFVGFDAAPQPVRMNAVADTHAARQHLEELKSGLTEGGLDVIALHTHGSSAERILQEARQQAADLIVLGSHGHGAIYNLLVGGVASGVLKEALCSVLVIPAPRK